MDTIDRILGLMSERKVTAAQLTREAGITNGLITQWRQGKQKPSMNNIEKIAAYFSVSTDYLLGRVDNPKGNLPHLSFGELEGAKNDGHPYPLKFSVTSTDGELQGVRDFLDKNNLEFTEDVQEIKKAAPTGERLSDEILATALRFHALSPEVRARVLGYLDSLEQQEKQ